VRCGLSVAELKKDFRSMQGSFLDFSADNESGMEFPVCALGVRGTAPRMPFPPVREAASDSASAVVRQLWTMATERRTVPAAGQKR
jgi:hypothetical protein